jgi:hypothetical protein
MIPWLFSVVDYDSTPETYARYDSMSALDMFRAYGVSKRMYEEFIKPTLLVGLFAPPEELSAGATMGCLYYYGELPGIVPTLSTLFTPPIPHFWDCISVLPRLLQFSAC